MEEKKAMLLIDDPDDAREAPDPEAVRRWYTEALPGVTPGGSGGRLVEIPPRHAGAHDLRLSANGDVAPGKPMTVADVVDRMSDDDVKALGMALEPESPLYAALQAEMVAGRWKFWIATRQPDKHVFVVTAELSCGCQQKITIADADLIRAASPRMALKVAEAKAVTKRCMKCIDSIPPDFTAGGSFDVPSGDGSSVQKFNAAPGERIEIAPPGGLAVTLAKREIDKANPPTSPIDYTSFTEAAERCRREAGQALDRIFATDASPLAEKFANFRSEPEDTPGWGRLATSVAAAQSVEVAMSGIILTDSAPACSGCGNPGVSAVKTAAGWEGRCGKDGRCAGAVMLGEALVAKAPAVRRCAHCLTETPLTAIAAFMVRWKNGTAAGVVETCDSESCRAWAMRGVRRASELMPGIPLARVMWDLEVLTKAPPESPAQTLARIKASRAAGHCTAAEARGALLRMMYEPRKMKHGPGGSGRPGLCDADCLKCAVDVELRALPPFAKAPLPEQIPALRAKLDEICQAPSQPLMLDSDVVPSRPDAEAVIRVLRANAPAIRALAKGTPFEAPARSPCRWATPEEQAQHEANSRPKPGDPPPPSSVCLGFAEDGYAPTVEIAGFRSASRADGFSQDKIDAIKMQMLATKGAKR